MVLRDGRRSYWLTEPGVYDVTLRYAQSGEMARWFTMIEWPAPMFSGRSDDLRVTFSIVR